MLFGRKFDVVIAAFHIKSKTGLFPTRKQVMEKVELETGLPLSDSNLSTLKGKLVKDDYLEEHRKLIILTNKAILEIERQNTRVTKIHPFTVLPAELVNRGDVQAGKVSPEELKYDNYLGEHEITISLPKTTQERVVYALQVKGSSMEGDAIIEGDYVIIENYPTTGSAREGDLIVTMYLPEKYNKKELEQLTFFSTTFDNLDSELEGPTLKYYRKEPEQERDEKREYEIHQLSPKKNFREEHVIRTRYIRPIGKVIGVYRNTSK